MHTPPPPHAPPHAQPFPWISTLPGVRRQTQCVGTTVMQVIVELAPNAPTPEHAHVHEQLIRVLAGDVILTVEGTPHRLTAGDSFALPSNIRHGATAGPAGATLLDTFTPLREDFLEQDRAARP